MPRIVIPIRSAISVSIVYVKYNTRPRVRRKPCTFCIPRPTTIYYTFANATEENEPAHLVYTT